MSKVKRLRREIKSKLEIVKKIQDDPKKSTDELYDLYLGNADLDKKLSNTIDGLKSKLKKKEKNNDEDIFGSVIGIASDFLSSKTNKISVENDKLLSSNKIKKYALESANITVKDSRNIVKESIKQFLFVNSESSICGVDTPIPTDTMVISPKEFDFLNVLQTDPSSKVGIIMYEQESPTYGDIKMNREFYGAFSSNYSFTSKSGNNLFDLTWNTTNQEYDVSGLQQGIVGAVKVSDFIDDYYDSVETPKIEHIIKTSMLMTLQGDGENPEGVDKALNYLNRLCSKLFKICGSSDESSQLQTTSQLFSENDQDILSYFDFNDVEGIDIDDEDSRYRKVLRFVDCGNFEVPSPQNSFEDFVYLSSGDLQSLVDSTLENVALNASLSVDDNKLFQNINLELVNLFILNVPKALVSSVISPKMIFPLVVAWKQIKGAVGDVYELMKKLGELIYIIIKKVFWRFLKEFWQFIKKDLLNFILSIGQRILKNKYKHYVRIITAIISLLRTLLNQGFDNCLAIFQAILAAVKGALNLPGGKINVPGFLLGFSDLLPGYSADRAYMNAAERMAAAGLNTGTIYGEANEYLIMTKAIIEGMSEEIDNNSFIKASNKLVTIPTPVGPIVIPPGIINSSGKMF